jgi:DNA-3-methyladenine glycosylase I
MKKRCGWAKGKDDVYIAYHDTEWGTPCHDDQTLFEFIVLESAQAGLSWQTILNKRAGYRKAFKNFDPKKVAKMTEANQAKLLLDPGIVRNRLKIASTISNAQAFLQVQREFGSFATYLWSWVDNTPINEKRKGMGDIPAVTPLAVVLAKDLKKRGFKFLGPTVCYAFMQAVGLVNDHTVDCFRHREVTKLAKSK